VKRSLIVFWQRCQQRKKERLSVFVLRMREKKYDAFYGNHPDLARITAINAVLDGRIAPNKKPHC